MKKAFAIFLLFTVSNVLADNWKDPNARFSTKKNFTNQSTITWNPVDNVQATCEAESRKRGLGGFGYPVEACSFWTGNSCIIITSKNPTNFTIGHEARHCFQGNYH